jgi:N-acetylglucosaminyldiphosphoundecaprenol N-acetyl-beta-D-mannosaminyltransferase
MPKRDTDLIIGQSVEIGTLESVSETILNQATLGKSAYICFTTAYMLVESLRDSTVRAAYAAGEMILPDGVPVAWCLRALGHREAECISGPRLTPVLLREAARRGISVGFYGGRTETLNKMIANLGRDLPTLKISYVCSPPFRALTRQEQQPMLDEINATGTQMLFVGLGSPKQDRWMHDYASQINCVSLGIGAAFEFLSGEKYLPPQWIQRLGLTWLIRLCQEPKRLIRRNLASPVFVFHFLRQHLLGTRFDHSEISRF